MADVIFAGLVKMKKYNWKDSNMALFGSDLERQVKSKYIGHSQKLVNPLLHRYSFFLVFKSAAADDI